MNLWNDIKAALGTKIGLAGIAYALQGPAMSLLKSDSADAISTAMKSFTLRDLITGAAIVFARAAISKLSKK